MTADPTVLPEVLLLAGELLALTALGYVVARIALRQSDELMALAQGMVIGLALWGLAANFVLHVLPGHLGAAMGWLVAVGVAGALAWRRRPSLPVSIGSLAGISAAALTLVWIGLAGWQAQTGSPDAIHLGLSAQIQAGGWPPALPWSPWEPVPYHYGVDLLIALLATPFGPELSLTSDVFGAFVWAAFALNVATVLRRSGGWVPALVLTPLLLSAGAWTLILWHQPPGVLQVPVPVGLPQAGLRAALEAIYWPAADASSNWPYDRLLPNIWTPWFVFSYALAVVVLERVANAPDRRWRDLPMGIALGALVGFLGLTDEAVAASVLGIWVVLGVARLVGDRPAGVVLRRELMRAAAGPAVAAIVLAVGGGVVTGVLTRSVGGGLSLAWAEDPGGRGLIGSLGQPGGGLGVLGLGPVAVTALAVLLGWRHRLALAFSLGSGVFLLAAFTLRYDLAAHDVVRFDGHARSFALLAVAIAASAGLRSLRPRWGHAAAWSVAALVVWPTIAGPVRGTGFQVSRGVHVANAEYGTERQGRAFGRTREAADERPLRAGLAAYIRDRTAVDARILSPWPQIVSVTTGRANASGFLDFLHLLNLEGPEYLDAIRYLDPAALRRLGIDFVHAPDEWTGELPVQAVRWLSNPLYFKPLARDGPDALYQVQPAFLRLDVEPTPASFESLRRAIPATATVYLVPGNRETLQEIRVASALSHTYVVGSVWTGQLHPLSPFPTEPIRGDAPDFVVASSRLVPSAFDPDDRQPVWWNESVAVYAPRGSVPPLMEPPKRMPNFGVRVSEAAATDGRLSFAARFSNRASDQWTGQDWLVTSGDGSPWAFPPAANTARRLRAPAVQWFAGQLVPRHHETVFRYEFEPSAARLAVRDGAGEIVDAASSGRSLTEGDWTLALRLRRDWHEVAFIPVMKVSISESGQASFQIYEGELDLRLAQ